MLKENERKNFKAQCICCEKELETEARCADPNSWYIVHEAILLRAHGNYGSTLYDPISGSEYLELFLCDGCLEKKAHLVSRLQYAKVAHFVGDETFAEYHARELKEFEESKRKKTRDELTPRARHDHG